VPRIQTTGETARRTGPRGQETPSGCPSVERARVASLAAIGEIDRANPLGDHGFIS